MPTPWTHEREAARSARMAQQRQQDENRANDAPYDWKEIAGDTYPVRDKLRSIGAVWVKHRRAWFIAPGGAEAARTIVATLAPNRRAKELAKLKRS